jgi:hypothetical protein
VSVVHWFRLGRTRVRVGAPTVVPPPELLVKSIFVDRNAKRHLISRALCAQIPNLGSVSRRVKHECSIFRLVLGLLEVILQRCHIQGFESSSRGLTPPKCTGKRARRSWRGFGARTRTQNFQIQGPCGGPVGGPTEGVVKRSGRRRKELGPTR